MKCLFCEDTGWVCENHPDQPLQGTPAPVAQPVHRARAERLICREVQVNLAYRWFCNLGIEDAIRIIRRFRAPATSVSAKEMSSAAGSATCSHVSTSCCNSRMIAFASDALSGSCEANITACRFQTERFSAACHCPQLIRVPRTRNCGNGTPRT